MRAPYLLISDVEKMVLDGVLIVHPRLVTTTGRSVMFMRPAAYFPSKTPTSDFIKLLAYMTQRMTEDTSAQVEGFTFVADLLNWKMQNFSQSYAMTWFLTMLAMPVKLHSFYIVDAPSWFGVVWSIIRNAMTRDFQSKVIYATRETIDQVLDRDHRPPDIAGGTLEIDLPAWCEDRRVAELGLVNTMGVFRKPTEPLERSTPRSVSSIRPSSSSSGPSGSESPSRTRSGTATPEQHTPRRASVLSTSGSSQMDSLNSDDEDDSGVKEAIQELERVGIDNAEYRTIARESSGILTALVAVNDLLQEITDEKHVALLKKVMGILTAELG